ncbi:porin [Caballeronia temeraria]|uniref:Porin n=1 Tax=Caballeronia temeraria TaxID=1777137 RepID=A0A158ANM5_9BURK|nr:porin [Caballeronia temeraria]SAK59591.1 porin [Caballeronia temeraria]
MRLVRRSICAAAMLLAAQAASAQSSVTLYGVIDVFGLWNNNGGTSTVSMRSGGNVGSLFGFKGSEDLGGGNKADFAIENGFNINNGTFLADSSVMFYRQSWVGLSNEKYGSLRFGRQYTPSFFIAYPADPFRLDEALGLAASAVLARDPATNGVQYLNGRQSNAVQYLSPTLAGFKFSALYGFSASVTQPTPTTFGNVMDFSLQYSGYGLYAGVGYQNQRPGQQTLGPIVTNLVASERFTGAIAYRLGIVNLQALYIYTKPDDAPAGSVAARMNSVHSYSIAQLGATVQVTPFDTFEAAFLHRDVRGAHDNTPAVQIGWDHSLSKRTSIYARAGYMKNNGNSTMSWTGIAVSKPQTSQTMAAVGMMHRF